MARESDRTPRRDTAQVILDAALALFRRRGYERATMRDVAAAAGLSLGAAYHYFPSKQAIVLAYFARTQDELDRKVSERLQGKRAFDERVLAVLEAYVDGFARDRKLLGALLGSALDPEGPLTPFGERLGGIRARSIARFAEAVAGANPSAPEGLAGVLPAALWGLMMASGLLVLHDRSPSQKRTRETISIAVSLVADLVRFAAVPGLEPTLEKVRRLATSLGVS